jgi:glycosyltransferase involved in cell wall biosynthesis
MSLRAKSRTNEIEKGNNSLSETQISFLFVGTLSIGKQPLYAIQLVEKLYKNGKKVTLELYGEGVLREELEEYILQNSLEKIVTLKGNQSKESLITAYQNSHFLLLPSKSEGWPKAVAEAMFWGCVPLATAVSCVPYMLDFGKRGKLLTLQLDADVQAIENVIANVDAYISLSENSKNWSQAFTLEVFETEIKKLLNCV